MKKFIAMLMFITMLVSCMPAMVWAEDEAADPNAETVETAAEVENTEKPVNAQVGTTYETRETACEFTYMTDPTLTPANACGRYYASFTGSSLADMKGNTIWVKLTANTDNSLIHLSWEDEFASCIYIDDVQMYRGDSDTPEMSFEKLPEEDYYVWDCLLEANKGDVFYFKLSLTQDSPDFYISTSLNAFDYINNGLGTIDDPHKFVQTEDDYACEGYRNERNREEWYVLNPIGGPYTLFFAFGDIDMDIKSIDIYKGSTSNKVSHLRYDNEWDEWSGKVPACYENTPVYIKISYKDSFHYTHNGIFINREDYHEPVYATIKAKTYTYTGSAIKPLPVVKDANGVTLVKGRDYKLTYEFNVNVGRGMVNIIPIGKYDNYECDYMYFKIVPKKTSLRSVSAGKKSFKAKWYKQATKMKSSRISGYQIQYSTSSKFKSGVKTVTVKGYSTTSKTIKKLKSKKKYYVRIRTYKSVDGSKYYSSWSKVKTVKTK